MGKNKDKKKKGLGAEKTKLKTEKKAQKNLKKELAEIGEPSIEELIAAFKENEKQLNQVKEETLPVGQAPSPRGSASFNLFPEKDELVLFGGEYYDGQKVYVYNDLFVYSIKKNQWTKVVAPNGPAPRSSHQGALTSRNGGELWIFGGEFTSPSQSQFYHYNDLWVYQFQSKQWTKISSPKNAPNGRSGHRMIIFKKYLVLFGGYYDNGRDCRFFNDTFLFNMETNQWEELKFPATLGDNLPTPRSACHLLVNNKNNSIVLFGGFSKEKLKKDKEKPIIHSNMFVLMQETKKDNKVEWTWKKVKQGGQRPSERISYSMIPISDDSAILFGGVFDHMENDDDDDDEEAESLSTFYNDLYRLDLSSHKWTEVVLRGKKEVKTKKKKEKKEGDAMETDDDESDDGDEQMEEAIDIDKLTLDVQPKTTTTDVFTLTVAAAKSDNNPVVEEKDKVTLNKPLVLPHVRRSAHLQFHKGILYLFGGKYEDSEDREFTFNDLWCLNVKKMDEWKVLIEDKKTKDLDAKALSKDASSEESDLEKDDGDEDDDDDDESDMEIDAPPVLAGESVDDYFKRTNELWLSEASKEFPDEKSKKVLNKMALELCKLFYENLKDE